MGRKKKSDGLDGKKKSKRNGRSKRKGKNVMSGSLGWRSTHGTGLGEM